MDGAMSALEHSLQEALSGLTAALKRVAELETAIRSMRCNCMGVWTDGKQASQATCTRCKVLGEGDEWQQR